MGKKSKLYVYSTLTNDNEYGLYNKGGSDLPVRSASIVIKGGANVADKRIVTPRGVATEITPEQLEQLRQDTTFVHHEKNGYLTVSEAKADADVVAADMEGRSPDAPLAPLDFSANEPAVTTNVSTQPEPEQPRQGRNRK